MCQKRTLHGAILDWETATTSRVKDTFFPIRLVPAIFRAVPSTNRICHISMDSRLSSPFADLEGGMERRLAAVMIADVAGYGRLSQASSP
jgi:hypothetical protein